MIKKIKKQEKNIVIGQNKKTNDYELIEKYTSGIVLKGNEVKSIKNYKVSINNSYIIQEANIKNKKKNELFIKGMKIYNEKNHNSAEINKKLLLKKSEIKKIKFLIQKKKNDRNNFKNIYKRKQMNKTRIFSSKKKEKIWNKKKIKKVEEKRLLET